jgi:hypothetical protein
MRVNGERDAPAALPPKKKPGTYCVEGWVGRGAGLECAGNIASTGIQSSDSPARNESPTTYAIRALSRGVTSVSRYRADTDTVVRCDHDCSRTSAFQQAAFAHCAIKDSACQILPQGGKFDIGNK